MSKFAGNAITWFEIPTSDMQRAVSFYETILDNKLQQWPDREAALKSPTEPCFMFPAGPGAVAGALIRRPHHQPATNGAMVYLNVDGQLDQVLARAHQIAGTVLLPRTQIPGGHGFYACVLDSEGNHIGLHTR